MKLPSDSNLLPGKVIHEALTFLAYIALAIGANYFVFHNYFMWDDWSWIGGGAIRYIYFDRWTQHFLLHGICGPLFGVAAGYYYALYLCIHAANAYLANKLYVGYFKLTPPITSNRPRFTIEQQAFVAGLVFSIYAANAQRWISSGSILLVVLFSLLSLNCAIRALERNSLWRWSLALLSYGLALFSHIYSLLLPAFLALLGSILRKRTPRPRSRRQSVLLISPFFIAAAGYCLIFRNNLIAPLGNGSQPRLELLRRLQLFPEYLKFVVIQFWRQIQPGDINNSSSFAYSLALLCTIIVGFYGLARLHRNSRDPLGVTVLFLVIWNALSFPQTIGIQVEPFFHPHRYYFNAVGFAIVVAVFLGKALDYMLLLLSPAPFSLARAVKAGILPLMWVSALLVAWRQPNRAALDARIDEYFTMLRSFVAVMQRDLPAIPPPRLLYFRMDMSLHQGPAEEDFYYCVTGILGFPGTWTLINRTPKDDLNPDQEATERFYRYEAPEGFRAISESEYQALAATPGYVRDGPQKDFYPAFVMSGKL